MATVSTTINTNDRIVMDDESLVDYAGFGSFTPTLFGWLSTGLDAVFIHGSGFTYSGDGDARELTGGVIERISIDVDFDINTQTQGDLVITNTGALVGARIDKDNPRTFWNEVLKGNDVFLLSGLDEVNVGFGHNVVFGDDLYSANRIVAGIADGGGNDTILGTDNQLLVTGDVYRLAGVDLGVTARTAEYDAGDDRILGAITNHWSHMSGDTDQIRPFAILHGGDDYLDNSKNNYDFDDANVSGSDSFVSGDALSQTGGTVNGGNDEIYLDRAATGEGAGDVGFFHGGTVNGGNDTIFGVFNSLVSGDVQLMTAGTVNGGNDRITGGQGSDTVGGEVHSRTSASTTVVAANDTIFGVAGNDLLFGELAAGSLAGIAGGNDIISGGGGHDRLIGQTGNDHLAGDAGNDTLNGGPGNDWLTGGPGNDRLTGGLGADLLIFRPGMNDDTVVDFTDTGGAADDRIHVRAYNFASVAAIGKSASGDDLVLDFGNGETATLLDYLATHAIADINNDILI